MKKMLCVLLAVLTLVLGLSLTATAHEPELLMIDVEDGAIMYSSYDFEEAIPYAIIPDGSVALCIDAVSWGYCVAFGNYVGYIFEEDAYPVDPDYYEFELPTGENYAIGDAVLGPVTDVPEFPYDELECAGNQKIHTRSGPNNRYTSHKSIEVGHEVKVFYQTKNNGVEWAYIEFERDHKLFRVYTPLYRINVDDYLPDDGDDYVWATITRGHTPRLGPGSEYASAEHYVPALTKVRAYYQEDGWLMYDYQVNDERWQRGWAKPGDWR